MCIIAVESTWIVYLYTTDTVGRHSKIDINHVRIPYYPLLASLPPSKWIYLSHLINRKLFCTINDRNSNKTWYFICAEASNGGKTVRKVPEKRCNKNSSNFYFDVKAIFKAPRALIGDNTVHVCNNFYFTNFIH